MTVQGVNGRGRANGTGGAQRLASWVGICPGNNESAGKRKSGRIRKGNAWVRRLLCAHVLGDVAAR
jgi:transposase